MEKVKAVVDGAPRPASGLVPPRPPLPAAGWTAPATPPPAPVAPPSPVDPATALDELVDEIGGVRGAILASVDGFGLARSTSMNEEPSHPAMLAAAVGLAHQLVAMGGGEQLRQLVVDHDGGLLLVWPIGAQRVLAVLASPAVEQRRLRAFVQRCAPTLSGVSA
jgi:predicted regulator of Ras-like GTPase activity (Roadblock/LC7/MglB family)